MQMFDLDVTSVFSRASPKSQLPEIQTTALNQLSNEADRVLQKLTRHEKNKSGR